MLKYVENGGELYDSSQLKIFGLQNAGDIMLKYVENGGWLCEAAQYKILKLKNAGSIVRKYVENGGTFCNAATEDAFAFQDVSPEQLMSAMSEKAKSLVIRHCS